MEARYTNIKAYYPDVEVTDSASPDFSTAHILRYEDYPWMCEIDDLICETYGIWEQSRGTVACSYMGEIIWFITEDGHMYDKDKDGYYLEGFFVGGVEIHIEPNGHYELWM